MALLEATYELASFLYQAPKEEVRLYQRTQTAWEAMYTDCCRARTSIEFEQYIVHDDAIGRRFLELFARKATEGVKIRLLLDRVGSRDIFHSPHLEIIRDWGGQVEFYNPIGWINLLTPHKWFPRNHVKALLIDEEIAYVGGVCLADYMADWNDLHARLTGDAAEQVRKDFAYIWSIAEGTRSKKYNPASAAAKFEYIVAHPFQGHYPIYKQLLSQIASARKSICMATPYFLPPLCLQIALKQAALRGVNVKIVVTEKSDVPFAVCISQSYFPKWIQNGIRIFSYQPTVWHGKYVVIDEEWAMMGSTNLDYLSLLKNREANLLIHNPMTICKIQDNFDQILKNCHELSMNFWKQQPLHRKLIGYAGRGIKKIL